MVWACSATIAGIVALSICCLSLVRGAMADFQRQVLRLTQRMVDDATAAKEACLSMRRVTTTAPVSPATPSPPPVAKQITEHVEQMLN